MNKEEETYNHQVNNYIVDRIKAIQIDNMDEIADNCSWSDVVKGTKASYGYSEKEDYEKADSDDETVLTNNKSLQSNESLESLTDISQKSMQTKVILEMQEIIKQMKEEQQFMRDHIKDLENTVITLAEESKGTKSYKSAEAKAKKLKKKRKLDEAKLKDKKVNKTDKVEPRRSKRLITLKIRNNKVVNENKKEIMKSPKTVIKNKENEIDMDMEKDDSQ